MQIVDNVAEGGGVGVTVAFVATNVPHLPHDSLAVQRREFGRAAIFHSRLLPKRYRLAVK